MAALRALFACLVLAALASGCISDGTSAASDAPEAAGQAQDGQDSQAGSRASDDDAQPGDGTDEPAPGATQSAAASCDAPATHGDPQRDDGTVDVSPQGSQFVARRTVTIDNDFGGAERSTVLLTSFNGAIAIAPSTDCGYHLVAQLFGSGATPDDARNALDLLTLANTDDLGAGGVLDLSFVLTSEAAAGVPLPIGLPTGLNNGGSFQLTVPPRPSHDLEAGSSNGAIDATGLHGPRLKATSSNGGLSVQGSFDSLELGSSNGGIDLDGTFHDVVGQTSNGGISLDLRPTRSGTLRLTTSNGAMEVGLPQDESAFDVTGDTSNGEVRFDLEGRESEDDDHGTFRSADWASASVQVTLELGTSNGSIDVED